jgi:hypothetical protein
MNLIPYLRSIKRYLQALVSEPDGSPSSTRFLMFVFSIFSMHLIWRCFYHIFTLHDTTLVTVWLSNMPMLVTTLMGFIALPYGINKGTATFSDIANMIANSRQTNINANLKDLKDVVMNKNVSITDPETPEAAPPAAPAAPTPPTPEAPATATGSAGEKG